MVHHETGGSLIAFKVFAEVRFTPTLTDQLRSVEEGGREGDAGCH